MAMAPIMADDNSDPSKTSPIQFKSEDKTVIVYSLPKGHFLALCVTL
jgi:hypothetical protein